MKKLYYRFNRVPVINKSYTLKFLLIAFIGIHLPLILFSTIFLTRLAKLSAMGIFLVLLSTTLVATGITLFLQNALLQPVKHVQKILDEYIVSGHLPETVPESPDEIGKLTSQTHATIYKLDKLLQEKEEIATLLSHDLNLPLTQITVLTQLVEKENLPESARKHNETIATIAKQQAKLIKTMLQLFASGKSVADEIHFEQFDLYEVLDKILKEVRSAVFQKGLVINNNIAQNTLVCGYRELLKPAVQNLLCNAIRVSPEKGNISIDVCNQDKTMQLHIKDEGIGFSSEEAQQLFALKENRPASTSAPGKLKGINLYLVKKVAEKHKGTVNAYSEGKGKGATFTLTLPTEFMQ